MYSKINYTYLFIFLFLKTSFVNTEIIEIKVGNPTAQPILDKENADDKKSAVVRGDFFEEIMGFKENEIIAIWKKISKANKEKQDLSDSKKFEDAAKKELELNLFKQEYEKLMNGTYLQGNKVLMLINKKNITKAFEAGIFSEISIGELRKHMPSGQPGKFNVIAGIGTSSSSWFRRKLDIGAVQALPENNYAYFQVASNFSALEPVSNKDFPENGVTKYINDFTQGPFASISAAPGVILRMYYIFWSENRFDPTYTWRQTKNKQINFLDAVADKFPMQNGYVNLNGINLKENVTKEEYEQIKIGFHERIQVTYGYLINSSMHVKLDRINQEINQIFTAGIDFGSLNYKLSNDKEAIARGKIILDAAYEGTIRSTAQNYDQLILARKDTKKSDYSNKLFLTLIGGGVFGNSWDWIAQAIVKNADFIKKSGLDITLFIYNLNGYIGANKEEFQKTLFDLVNSTNGKFTIYKADGVYELQEKQEKKIGIDLNNFESFYKLRLELNNLSNLTK